MMGKKGRKKYVGSKPTGSFPRKTNKVPGKSTLKTFKTNTVAKPGKATHRGYTQRTGGTVAGYYSGKQKKEWDYIDSVVNK